MFRSMRTPKKRLLGCYRFPGFRPDPVVRGVFGDPMAVAITLKRRAYELRDQEYLRLKILTSTLPDP